MLIGFVLLEARWWGAGPYVFAGACLLTALRSIALLRSSRPDLIVAARRARAVLGGTGVHLALLVAGAGLSAAGAVISAPVTPRSGGLLLSISPCWTVGVLLLLVAVLWLWRARSPLFGASVVCFCVTATATASIVYPYARFDWTQPHVGLTDLFLVRGHTLPGLNIYQAWPSFFAGVAWLCKAIGAAPLEKIAAWWPAAADLVGLLCITAIASALGLRRSAGWLAALLFTLGNIVAQDYFSPQSAAYVMALAFVALWVRVEKGSRPGRADWVLGAVAAAAIATSHELTPFALAGFTAIFAAFGLLKSRWVVALIGVPTVAWAALHAQDISTWGHLGQLGNLGANITTPNASLGYHYDLAVRLNVLGQIGAPLIVGILALVALVAQRDRLNLCLATCVVSCGALFVVHYGTEDVLRITLFSVPWLSLLAGRGLTAAKHGGNRPRPRHALPSSRPSSQVAWRLALTVAVVPLTACYFMATSVIDDVYVVRATDLQMSRIFEATAPQGSLLLGVGNPSYLPAGSTWQSIYYEYYGQTPVAQGSATPEEAATRSLQSLLELASSISGSQQEEGEGAARVYVVFTTQEETQLAAVGEFSPAAYWSMAGQAERCPSLRVVAHNSSAVLLEYHAKGGR
jgi:hypothetical protein